MEIKFMKEPETNKIIGKPLKIENRILYPVIEISILKGKEGNIIGIWSIPIAILIEEGSDKFILPLKDENIDLDEIIEMLSQ